MRPPPSVRPSVKVSSRDRPRSASPWCSSSLRRSASRPVSGCPGSISVSRNVATTSRDRSSGEASRKRNSAIVASSTQCRSSRTRIASPPEDALPEHLQRCHRHQSGQDGRVDGVGEGRQPGGEPRQDRGQRPAPWPHDRFERSRPVLEVGEQRVGHRTERRGEVLHAPAGEQVRAGLEPRLERLGHEGGLPHTGLTADRDDPPGSAPRRGERLVDGDQLVLAPDEVRRRREPEGLRDDGRGLDRRAELVGRHRARPAPPPVPTGR